MTQEIRNIAIIAHVDHGKTTLVDSLLKQTGTFRENQQVDTCVMDSGDIEKERGITIMAKCTSVVYKDIRINIVDTPGHADFGGEVERILSMVDGVVMLVDSAEGPLPQTKFVLGKALKLGLKPIVLINKIDRADARPMAVLDEIFDLFVSLGATDEQLDFPVLYACGRDGWAVNDLEKDPRTSITPLLDRVIEHVPSPKIEENQPFKMLITTLEYDNFVGRVLTGKILSGSIKVNEQIKALNMKNETIEMARASKIMAFRGLERTALTEAHAGDIVSIAGFSKATVADTLCHVSVDKAIEAMPIDPPTLAMTFSINTSPYAGTEGDKVTSRMIWDRLCREVEGNVALKISRTDKTDSFEVAGRGELQLGILIEQMRREGFELSISRPRVLFQKDDNGNVTEPLEEVVVDVDENYSGVVVDKMSQRKAELKEMIPTTGKVRMVFIAPSRGLIGYHSEFLTDTCGTGVMNRIFHSYGPYRGKIDDRHRGALISTEQGKAVAYSLWKLQERGVLFVSHNTPVYVGMIIGESAKPGDIEVNPIKGKQLTNMRAAGKDDAIILTPPRIMSLEEAIAYINDDELVEVTPNSIRLRKVILDSIERKRAEKRKEEI